MKNIILTGDRPTGKLHIGHYVGSLKNRILMQNEGAYDKMYVMVADAQALTDNFGDVSKVKNNIIEVALDYLAVGLDPKKVTMFIQSEIPELTELTFYYMNLVTLARLQRNPTVKGELQLRDFSKSIPMGFLCYPISQAADITAFDANLVPVGADQLPMLEQTNEIVRSFNRLYGDTLVECKPILSSNENSMRLIGLDGKSKMSKSLGNCIFLCDSADEIKAKVMSMFTDPDHIRVSDAGKVEGNAVFTYLDAFCEQEHFDRYLNSYSSLDELKAHYRRGGLGDMVIKRFLNSILQELLEPIRTRRHELQANHTSIMEMLYKGSDEARKVASDTLSRVKNAMGICYR